MILLIQALTVIPLTYSYAYWQHQQQISQQHQTYVASLTPVMIFLITVGYVAPCLAMAAYLVQLWRDQWQRTLTTLAVIEATMTWGFLFWTWR